jgi:hypothetical protein
MDIEGFVRWALDDARTLEERYTTELIVEHGVWMWNLRHRVHRAVSIDESIERKRQRALNPAYEPHYSEEAARRAAEGWLGTKQWSVHCSHDDRPIRDLQAFRWLTDLEELHLHANEAADVSPLAALPRLRSLHFGSSDCRDLRPLARCAGLRDLQLKLLRHWPAVDGIAQLPAVESLLLDGNLLVFERAVFAQAKYAVLRCDPLEARSVRDLPQLPACEFLSLAGVETLEGIDAFPRLRNFTLESPADSFEPLTALPGLTCVTALDHEPMDVAPLTRVPRLQFLCLNTWNKTRLRPVKPRDLAPLADAASLRELEVIGNPLLQTEAAAIQAGLPSWDDLYLLPEPRPLPPWRLLAWPAVRIPPAPEVSRLPDEPELVDLGLRARELRWAHRFLQRAITQKLGTSDWHEPEQDHSFFQSYHPHIVSPTHRSLHLAFHSYGLLEKIPLVVEAIRECLARFRPEYRVQFWVQLRVPKRPPTPAQIEMEEKFQKEQDEAEWERGVKEREEYLERLHRYELKKQEGAKVNPEEFAPGARQPLPPPPWERDDDEDEDDDANGGDIALKEKPDPPPSWEDEQHPLADNYNLIAQFTLAECYVSNHQKSVAEYLLHRPCDEVIEDEKKE